MATFPAAVEQWRSLVEKYFPPEQVDKALYVIMHESGGRNILQLDSKGNQVGPAAGPFQIEGKEQHPNNPSRLTMQQLLDPETNIREAARMASKNWNQWTDWGEGVLYQGKPFGALGNFPYQRNLPAPAAPAAPPLPATPPQGAPPMPGQEDLDYLARIVTKNPNATWDALTQQEKDKARLIAPELKIDMTGKPPSGQVQDRQAYNPATKQQEWQQSLDGGKTWTFTGVIADRPPNDPAAQKPQGSITMAQLQEAKARFTGPGVAVVGGKEYRENPDKTWSVSGNAASSQQKISPLEQSTAAYANVQKTLQGGGSTLPGMGEQPSLKAAPSSPMANLPAPTLDRNAPQVNQVFDPVAGKMVTTSILAPEIGGDPERGISGGRMTLDKGWADTVLRTAGLVPSGNIDSDMQAALAQDALRQKLWHEQGMSPLQAQSAIDAVNRGATTQERARSQQLAGDMLLQGKGTQPFKQGAAMTLSELSSLLRPTEEENFYDPFNFMQAEGGSNVAGLDEDMRNRTQGYFPGGIGNGFTTNEPVGMVGLNSGQLQAVAGEAGPEAIDVRPLGPRPEFGMDAEEVAAQRRGEGLGPRGSRMPMPMPTRQERFWLDPGVQSVSRATGGAGDWYGARPDFVREMYYKGATPNWGRLQSDARQILGGTGSLGSNAGGGAMTSMINALLQKPEYWEMIPNFREGYGAVWMADGGTGYAGLGDNSTPMIPAASMAPPAPLPTPFAQLLETLMTPRNKGNRTPPLRPVGASMLQGAA